MEQKLDLAVLRANMLFRNLTDEEVLSVIDTMSPHTMKYEKRTVVARDGDGFSEIGVILSGSVHLFHIDSNGNSNLMDVLGAGDTLGELSAVGRYRLHVTVTATAQTEILFLSVDRLLRKNVLTAPTQIRFLQNLTLAVAKKGQYLTRKLEDSIRRSMDMVATAFEKQLDALYKDSALDIETDIEVLETMLSTEQGSGNMPMGGV